MNGLLALDIPDGLPERRDWLTRHLVGCHLAELVAELCAIFPPKDDHWPTLEELLGPQLGKIVRDGADAITSNDLQVLLQNPLLLLDLQQHILIDGGQSWQDSSLDSVDISGIASKCESAILETLDSQMVINDESLSSIDVPKPLPERGSRGQSAETVNLKNTPTSVPARPQPPGPDRRPSFGSASKPAPVVAKPAATKGRSRWPVALTAALALVAGFVGGREWQVRQPTLASEWGWNHTEAMGRDLTREAYLGRLAETANEWFQVEPTTAADMAARVAEFRQGCSRLLLTDHPPLGKADKEWLAERCRKWSGKFDEHLAALERGADVKQVRYAAGETVKKLVAALKERVAQPAA
jgi:hypothetical protein